MSHDISDSPWWFSCLLKTFLQPSKVHQIFCCSDMYHIYPDTQGKFFFLIHYKVKCVLDRYFLVLVLVKEDVDKYILSWWGLAGVIGSCKGSWVVWCYFFFNNESLSDQQHNGSLFTLFLHSPLTAFCFICNILNIPIHLWERCQSFIDRFVTEASRLFTRCRIGESNEGSFSHRMPLSGLLIYCCSVAHSSRDCWFWKLTIRNSQ
jgi:hypothetical protein